MPDATAGAAPETAEPDALAIRQLGHRYGATVALDDVSLSVPCGAFVVLLGLNGAGKTTLISLVTRLFDSISGEILVVGHDVRRRPGAALARLGVVFQSRALDMDLTLEQNLIYHAALHGIGGRAARRRSGEVLRLVGLEARISDPVSALSGGQVRRLEIARALLHEPHCLLLDEPTVGLDVAARENVLAIVRGLVRRERVGVLWATHLIDEIEPGDGIVVLHQGRVRYAGGGPGLLAATGCAGIAAAFKTLTGIGDDQRGAARP